MPIITIDGNIGSGKTSVLNYLHKYYKIPVDLEPVDHWDKYLNEIYNNNKTNLDSEENCRSNDASNANDNNTNHDENNSVFKFQVRVWLDRCWVQEKSEKSLILMERSPYFIKNVFIKSARDLKMITEKEHEVLVSLHKNTDKMWCPSYYIYLRSNPDNCSKKIKKRNRPSEKNISNEYIKLLHDIHEETFQKYIFGDSSNINHVNNITQITCIDVDGKTVVEIANEILELIQSHYPSHKYI